MASRKKAQQSVNPNEHIVDDIASQLITDLNKEFGQRIAYNLAEAAAPTVVKRWLSTNSVLLDYAIANKKSGGVPSGRIIELSGLPSTGKSHIALELCRTVQREGGLVVYVDTENATMPEKLAQVGINVKQRFVYIDSHCTEEVMAVIESTVRKAKSIADKNLPILVVWDSVAATSPKAELEGEYDQNTVGLQARTLSKGMRKITGVLGEYGVTLLCLNQLRMKINSYMGDPYVTPGGAAIPFHSSVRIRLTGEGTALKDAAGNVIGIKVPLKIIKNKVAPPFKSFDISIIFGKGIVESEQLLDTLVDWFDVNKEATKNGRIIKLEGKGKQWKSLSVFDAQTGELLHDKKFQKCDFDALRRDETFGSIWEDAIEMALTVQYGDSEHLVQEELALNPVSDEEEATTDE